MKTKPRKIRAWAVLDSQNHLSKSHAGKYRIFDSKSMAARIQDFGLDEAIALVEIRPIHRRKKS